jgi:hypothetical protein
MDENTKLLLELTRKQQSTSERDPILHDVKSLLEEGRKRIYTPEGQKVVDAARRNENEKS